MKKIFESIKSFLAKLNILEAKVEKIVDNSKILSDKQKKKIKAGLQKMDEVEKNVEQAVGDAEGTVEKFESVSKTLKKN